MPGPDLLDTLLRVHGAEALGREYVFVRLARMNVAGHVDYSEISRILQQIRRKADWYPVWMAASERHAALAEAAREAGATTSAGDAFLRAALCAHWATFFAKPAEKSSGHSRSLDLYAAGATWFEPPSQRVEIPFDGDVLPGYLRRPAGVEAPQLVLMLGGADTNKEELHYWGTQLTRRGFAVLPFDGPGQGELSARYGRLTMRFDRFHRAVSTVIDWVKTQELELGLDLNGIALFGNSLGGYLGLDAALRDERIQVVISNGGFADAAERELWPDGVITAFNSCLGIDDPKDVRKHVEEHLDLSKVPVANAPIALVVHGGKEDLSDEDEARRAAQTVDGTLLVVEDGWHTCTNRDHLISPIFADWTAAAMAGGVRRGYREVRVMDEEGYAAVLATGGDA